MLVGSVLVGGAAIAQTSGKGSGTQTRGDAFLGNHVAKPLPFDPKKLPGLSEKLLVSHHDKNYAGAVKNLNGVEEQLSKIGPETPGFAVAGLEAAKLKFTNSMILHELYFENLGGGGSPAGSQIERALAQAYGSHAGGKSCSEPSATRSAAAAGGRSSIGTSTPAARASIGPATTPTRWRRVYRSW